MNLRGVGRRLLMLSLLAMLPVLLVLASCSANAPSGAVVMAAPNVFSGPVNGGCYLDTITTCRLHIDNWQPIAVDPNTSLDGFRLIAQRHGGRAMILYDFRTDVSNPPAGTYLPSLVKKDFLAECGLTYQLILTVKDSGDTGYEETGRTDAFTCPVAATPTPSPTPSATPVNMPVAGTATPAGTLPAGWNLKLPVILGQ
jgi:hypothetical protein